MDYNHAQLTWWGYRLCMTMMRPTLLQSQEKLILVVSFCCVVEVYVCFWYSVLRFLIKYVMLWVCLLGHNRILTLSVTQSHYFLTPNVYYFPTVPPPPSTCTFSDVTSTSMRVKWTVPSISCQITNYSLSWTYDVLWSEDQGSDQIIAKGTEISIKDLIPWTKYTYSISAATDAGYGEPLSCSSATLEDRKTHPCSEVKNVMWNYDYFHLWGSYISSFLTLAVHGIMPLEISEWLSPSVSFPLHCSTGSSRLKLLFLSTYTILSSLLPGHSSRSC